MAYRAELSEEFEETSDVLQKNRKNACKFTRRWSNHEVELLIDLLEEASCLLDVSNKHYSLRKKWDGL